MKTLVHKNLHNGLWALTQRGRVVGYCESCQLIDWDSKEDAKKAAFSRSGNKRTVHLWARGTLSRVVGFQPLNGRLASYDFCGGYPTGGSLVRYNPKRGECGFMVDGVAMPSGKVANFIIQDGVSQMRVS
jgi:hypothetical protein